MATSDDVKINIITEMKDSLRTMAAYVASITAAIASVKKIVSTIKEWEDAYRSQILSETKLSAALMATGNQVNYTRRELIDIASEMQRLTTISDDEVISAQAIMTTFTKIGHDVFPQAIKAAADMSAMFGQDLQQSAIQLGTALNDPIAGIGRLKRIGISFTDDQKKSIEAFVEQNDIISAQKVILDELGVEIGGVAEAMGGQAVNASVALKNATGDLSEEFGSIITKALVPARQNMTEYITKISEALRKTREFQEVMSARVTISDNAPARALLDAAKTYGDELSAALEHAQSVVNKALQETTFEWATRKISELLGKQVVSQGDVDILIAKIAANNTYIETLNGLVSAEEKARTSSYEMSELDKAVLKVWDDLSIAMKEITLNEKDLGDAYDDEAEKQAAVLAALKALNATGVDNIKNKETLIALYGQYLPMVEREEEAIGREANSIWGLIRVLEQQADEYDRLAAIKVKAGKSDLISHKDPIWTLADELRDIGDALNDTFGDEALDAIRQFGESLAMGDNAATSFAKALDSFIATFLAMLPKMLLQAGLNTLAHASTKAELAAGLGLVGASGLVALASGLWNGADRETVTSGGTSASVGAGNTYVIQGNVFTRDDLAGEVVAAASAGNRGY